MLTSSLFGTAVNTMFDKVFSPNFILQCKTHISEVHLVMGCLLTVIIGIGASLAGPVLAESLFWRFNKIH